jgi:hypothetical protein
MSVFCSCIFEAVCKPQYNTVLAMLCDLSSVFLKGYTHMYAYIAHTIEGAFKSLNRQTN